MPNTTTDEGIVKLRWKTVVPVVLGLLLTTNTVTGLIFNQDVNTENIDYNYQRNNRKFESTMVEVKQLIHIAVLEEKIESLQEHNDIRDDIILLDNRITHLETPGTDEK